MYRFVLVIVINVIIYYLLLFYFYFQLLNCWCWWFVVFVASGIQPTIQQKNKKISKRLQRWQRNHFVLAWFLSESSSFSSSSSFSIGFSFSFGPPDLWWRSPYSVPTESYKKTVHYRLPSVNVCDISNSTHFIIQQVRKGFLNDSLTNLFELDSCTP